MLKLPWILLTSERHIISLYFLLVILEHELFLCIALCRRAHKNFCNDQITAINEQDTNSGSLLSVQTLCSLQKVIGKGEGSKTLSNSKMFLRTSKKVRVLKERKPVKPRDPRFSEELCQTFRGSFWVCQQASAFLRHAQAYTLKSV